MDSKLPLGICKQCLMKLDSALEDINEIKEDEDVSEDDKQDFETMGAYIGQIMAAISNKVSREMNEDDFINENIDMDPFEDEYDEGGDDDIMDMEIPEN